MEVVNEYGAVELLALPTLSTDYWSAGKGKTTPWSRCPGPHGTRGCGGVGGSGNGNAARAGAGTWAAPPMPAKAGICRAGGRGEPNCCAPCHPSISVGLPLIWLLRSLDQLRQDSLAELLVLGSHSLVLAVVGAGLATAMALILAIGKRWISPGPLRQAMFTASLGYAVPGTVLAIALLLLLRPWDFRRCSY